MSTRDFFKNSVLEAFGQVDPAKIGLSLLVALAMGILIYFVYKRFFTGVVYSRSFAVTLVGMCVLTCMVTLAISTNVVISLGMVGALSIVRYRTAVKDPLDLLYLFWAITTGITAGAGMYALVGLTAVVIVVMIAGFASHQDKARVYMMVIHYTGQTTGDDIVRAFGRTKFTLKSKTMRGDKVEMAVEVFSDGVDMPYADAIRALDGVEDLTLIQYNGEYQVSWVSALADVFSTWVKSIHLECLYGYHGESDFNDRGTIGKDERCRRAGGRFERRGLALS